MHNASSRGRLVARMEQNRYIRVASLVW